VSLRVRRPWLRLRLRFRPKRQRKLGVQFWLALGSLAITSLMACAEQRNARIGPLGTCFRLGALLQVTR
jgi:hypothetical protein